GDVHTFQYQPGQKKYDAQKLETPFKQGHDTEAICFDASSNRLLIAPKEAQLGQLKGEKNYKGIYPFSLDDKKMGEAAYAIDLQVLGNLLYQDNKRYTVKPSGMAFHPTSGELYVVSSYGHLLVVLDKNNKLVHVELLDEKLLPQPEGITFLPDHTLVISSEGQGGRGVILSFRPR
ncbi:MAG: SdiA-regulated domain-containing protein, partial [Bacteroidota bacterium]